MVGVVGGLGEAVLSVRVRSIALSFAVGLIAASCGHEPDAASGAESGAPIDRSFVDRFRTVDQSFWVVANGWTNGDWMDAVFLADQLDWGRDGLEISLEPVGRQIQPYATGELQSHLFFEGGYFEIDMKVPRGSGMVSGFFTYTGPFFDAPHDEIDIEILGKDTTVIEVTIFNDGVSHGVDLPLGFDAADDFHVYGIEWLPGSIRWFVDGVQIHEETGADFPLPTEPQKLYLHLWNSSSLTDWLGPLDAEGMPKVLAARCVAHAPRYEGRSLCRDGE